jgi:hypothetical protein
MARAELKLAGMDCDTPPYEAAASELLAAHWLTVQTIAERLAAVDELTPAEISEMIDRA